MEIEVSPSFKKKVRLIHKNNLKLYLKANKTIKLFIENPNHPSLRLHKLNHSSRWSMSVTMDIRITYEYFKGCILLVNIGTHDEVYK